MNNQPQPLRDLITSSDGVDFRGLLRILIEKAWLILLCVIAAGFLGEAQIKRTPKAYQAKAVLQVDEEKKVLGFEAPNPDLENQEVVQTILESFHRRAFLQQVVEDEKLATDPQFSSQPLSVEAATDMLSNSFVIQMRHGTRLLDLIAEHQNPEMAQKLANDLSTQFIRQTVKQRFLNSQVTTNFLLEEANKQKARLQQSEEALQAYKEKYNAISLDAKQDTVVSKLKSESDQLTDAKALRLRLETDYEAVKKLANNPEALLQIGSVANYPTILESRQQIAGLQAKLATMVPLRYTEKHPKVILLRSQIADLQARLRQDALKIPPLIGSAYDTAVANEAKFGSSQKDQEKQALELNKQAISYNVLVRDVETNGALYEAILKKLKEADVVKGVELRNLQIFEPAGLPTFPAKPQKSRILLLSIAAGLLAGVGLSLAIYAFDSSIKTTDEAENITGLRVIGSIPRARRSLLKASDILMVKQPDSPVAEHFRSLRTALQLHGKKVGNRTGCATFLFTSALPAEGKTFCSVNCAVSLAQQELRTLLIDADLRAPSAEKYFFDKRKTPGLTNYLSGEVDPMAAVHPTKIENLFVLPTGKPAPNPAELLSGPAFSTLLSLLAERFDRIVIDTAPLIPISDTLLLVDSSQCICLVGRAAKTPRKAVQRACELLADGGVTPVGLVLNQLPTRSGADAYYSGSYGDSYGTAEPKLAVSKPVEVAKTEAEKPPARRKAKVPKPANT